MAHTQMRLTALIYGRVSGSARLGEFLFGDFEEQAMADLELRLGDADVQKVLARALELQAQGAAALTVAQIREIASDLAIPESAVDQALSEYRAAATAGLPAEPSAAPSVRARRRVGRMLMLSMAVVGTVFVFLILVTFIMRLKP
jgi:hypothetical protein